MSDSDYYVDVTLNLYDINKGIVNIKVGFVPLKPAEFIIIKLQQVASLTEI